MNYRKIYSIIFLLFVFAGFSAAQEQKKDEWVSLFDGKNLNGWSIHSGFAKYHIEDDAIVGSTVKGSPNSFLCTDREYGDFILEFEVLLDPRLNSGVQVRSKIAKEEMVFVFTGRKGKQQTRTIPADRVYGYQVEIASEKGITLSEVAFLGNDINDLSCLECVALPIVVQDAFQDVVPFALYQTKHPGGHGAVREICDLFERTLMAK